MNQKPVLIIRVPSLSLPGPRERRIFSRAAMAAASVSATVLLSAQPLGDHPATRVHAARPSVPWRDSAQRLIKDPVSASFDVIADWDAAVHLAQGAAPVASTAAPAPGSTGTATGPGVAPSSPMRPTAVPAAQGGGDAPAVPADPIDLGTINAAVGSGKVFDWPSTVEKVAIADDTIANLRPLSPKDAVITGLKPGRTTAYAWLTDGRRVFYRLVVEPNLDLVRAALKGVNPGLTVELGADAESVVLRGEVPDEAAARQARLLTAQLIPGTMRVVSLLQARGALLTADDRLAAAMTAIDARIRVRPIQAGVNPDPTKDSYILEGRVRDVNALVQAVVIADRQLGGTGTSVRAADDQRVAYDRASSPGLAGLGSSSSGGANMGAALGGGTPPKNGIAAQVSRNLLLTSEDGRVVSLLEVDALPQVNVAIRVLQIDRSKARELGVNFRVDTQQFSIGSVTIPGTQAARSATQSIASAGNIVASYISGTRAVLAALDFLSEKSIARSVAEPNLLTLSGEQASVLIGGEIPIPIAVANQVTVQSSFAFQSFGVRMDIRPTVDDAGIVSLEVAPSIITPVPGLGNSGVPGFRVQRVETTARVPAGESLILGGLLSSQEAVQQRGIPGLDAIPLFRWSRKSEENTELLFVITPRIVEVPSPDVKLPPLEFQHGANQTGVTGLDATGVPSSFRPE